MPTRLNPYISLRDNSREAMEFYRAALGGELTATTFGEAGMSDNPADADLIMHSQLETEAGLTLMCADTPSFMEYTPGSSVTVSLSGDDVEELRGYYEKISAGGTVTAEYAKAPWGDTFGMCVDKYGIGWMFNAAGTPS